MTDNKLNELSKPVVGLLVIVMVADMALIASMVEWWFKL